MESLVGKKVRIRAIKNEGSARLLDGLTAMAIGPHPFAVNWVMIDLDPNPITPHRRWSIAADRLVLCEEHTQHHNAVHSALEDRTVNYRSGHPIF